MGKILRINLTTQEFFSEDVDPKLEEKYFGGMGVATALFTKEIDPKIDAFDEKNALMFSVGPFAGTSCTVLWKAFCVIKITINRTSWRSIKWRILEF